MRDEYEESDKRRQLMDERMQSLRRMHGLLPGLYYVYYLYTLCLKNFHIIFAHNLATL